MIASFAGNSLAYGEAAHIVDARASGVPPGVHWRVIPARDVIIAGPIAIFDAPGIFNEDSSSALLISGSPEVTPSQHLLLGIPPRSGAQAGWVTVEGTPHLTPHGQSEQLRVAAVADISAPNGADIEMTARDTAPWTIANTDIRQVRITGSGTVRSATAWYYPCTDVTLGDAPLQIVSLPRAIVEKIHGRDATASNAISAEVNVTDGAPVRPLPYSPGGSSIDEWHRVGRLAQRGGAIERWLNAMTALGSGAPVHERVTSTSELRLSAATALGVAASDPGVARWLGRQGLIRDDPDRWSGQTPAMIVAILPVITTAQPRDTSIQVARPRDTSIEVARRYEEATGVSLTSLREKYSSVGGRDSAAPRRVEVVALAMPFVHKLTPALPLQPDLHPVGPATWTVEQTSHDQFRTTGWEQSIALRGVAHTGPVSFVKLTADSSGEKRSTLHDVEDGVASPLLAGWSQPTLPGYALSLDASIRGREAVDPADAQPVRWEVQLEDWMGRWGPRAIIQVPPPATAKPAQPVLRATFVRATTGGTTPASPGKVHVEVLVALPSAPGALPITGVYVRINGGDPISLPVPDLSSGTGTARYAHEAPPTLPGDQQSVTVEGWVRDAASTESERTDPIRVVVVDARAVAPPTVSPRLVSAGRPGPAPEVAVTLTVNARAGAAYYRFYVASEGVVRAKLDAQLDLERIDFRRAPRAVRAAELYNQLRLPPREGFWLAETVEVVGTSKDGKPPTATCPLKVPSAHTDLLLVRAVPVTPAIDGYGKSVEGVEAPVESVEPAYVVVPLDEVPPVPRIQVSDTINGPLTLTVEVTGVDPATHDRLPGPLEARIVEAIDGADPFYWPQVCVAKLTEMGNGTFRGSVVMNGLPPWSRVRLAVAARFAAESMIVPGAELVLAPDLVAAGEQPEELPLPWGPVSAPVTIDMRGAEPVVNVDSTTQKEYRVSVHDLPSTASGSRAFTVVVYRRNGDGLLVESERRGVSSESSDFNLPADDSTVLALVDPFGRTIQTKSVRASEPNADPA